MSNYQRWSGGYVFKNAAKFKKFLKGIQGAFLEYDMEMYRLANVAYQARHFGTTGKWKKIMKQNNLSGTQFAELFKAYRISNQMGYDSPEYKWYWDNIDDLRKLENLEWNEGNAITSMLRQNNRSFPAIHEKMYKPKKPKKRDLSKGFYLEDFEFSVYPKALGVYADNNRPTFWNNSVGQWILKNYKSYGGRDETRSVSEYDEDEWGNSLY